MNNYYIKTNRAFTSIRKYAWMFTVLVALGGLWLPKLGLLVILVMVGLIITAFFTGRYWCGNFCPHGSLFDVVILKFSNNRKIPRFLKSKAMIISFLLFFSYSFSKKIIRVSKLWGTLPFLDRLGFAFVTTYLMVLIVGGILALFVNPRSWCQFCPMGTLQKLSYKLGQAFGIAKKTDRKVTITSTDMCHSCGKCSRVCPFQLTPYLEFNDNNQFDNINCIRCSTCVENCPAGILSIKTEKESIASMESISLEGYENRQKIKAQITDIVNLNEDIREYTFTFKDPEKVHYKEGQFILIKVQDEPKAYRAYSISSYNEDSSELKVIIKKVENGYGTEIIFNTFKFGHMIELQGPLGDELVPDENAEKILFIANGIGITPFIGLSKRILASHKSLKQVKLMNGQRYEKDFLYHDYFKGLEDEYESFEYIPVASRPTTAVKKGYVTDVLKETDLKGYKVYMCGTKNMVLDSLNILLSKGVDKQDIFYESEERITIR